MKAIKLKTLMVCVFLGLCSTNAWSESESASEETVENDKNRGYHFGLGLAMPTSIGADNNHYEKLFGSGSIYPEVWGEFTLLPLIWGFDLGLSFRMGLYRDSGKSARNVNPESNADLSDENVDDTQKSLLTLIPIQGAVNLSYSPFSKRYIVFNVWAGYSYTFIENTTQAKLDDSIDQSEIKPFVKSGFNQESVTGASISFDVSSIDPSSSYSLRVYGISGVFLTPFFQTVKTLKNKVGTYDRTIYGLMFSFETLGS